MRYWLAPIVLCAGLTSCGEPNIIVPDIMSIVALLPTHGSAGVSTDVQPLAYFSHVAASTTQVEESFTVTCLGAAVAGSCNAPNTVSCSSASPSATVTYDAGNQVARLVPDAPLAADTCYLLEVTGGIEAIDSNVGPLPVDIESEFRTR